MAKAPRARLERTTCRLEGGCSIQLSYRGGKANVDSASYADGDKGRRANPALMASRLWGHRFAVRCRTARRLHVHGIPASGQRAATVGAGERLSAVSDRNQQSAIGAGRGWRLNGLVHLRSASLKLRDVRGVDRTTRLAHPRPTGRGVCRVAGTPIARRWSVVAYDATARPARCSWRSWPQAAAMSRPRLARMCVFTPASTNRRWNRRTSPSAGRA